MKSFQKACLAIFTITLFLAACSKKESPTPSTAISSKHGDTLSHNNGQVCMNCHVSGEPGKNVWVVSGSVYQADKTTPSLNGTLYFWSEQGGTGSLVSTLEVDGKGNFYTTSSILPGSGTFPQIQGASGDVRNMPILAPNGNCNSCHGVTDPRIWVN